MPESEFTAVSNWKMAPSAESEAVMTSTHLGLSVIFKSISLMVIICAGAIENVAVIYAIVKDRRLHRAPYYFVINLMVADFLRSVVCLPFVQASVIHGSRWHYGSSLCKLVAFAGTFFVFGSVFALLVLAVDRYLSVVHHKFHAVRLRGVACLSMVLLGWGAAFLLAFPPIFGLGSYEFSPPQDQCTLEYKRGSVDVTLVFTVAFLLTASLTFLLYGVVMAYLRRHRRMKPVPLQTPRRSQTWNFLAPPGRPAARRPPAGVDSPRVPDGSVGLRFPSGQRLPDRLAPPPPPHIHDGLIQQQPQDRYVHLQVDNALIMSGQRMDQDTGSNLLRTSERLPAANDQLTRALFIVTLFYDAIWFPYVISTCWYVFHLDSAISQDTVTITTWFTYCQVALLPLVYILSHRPVGRHVLGTNNAGQEREMQLRSYPLNIDI